MAARPETRPAIGRSCHRPCCVAHLPSFFSSSLLKVSSLNLLSACMVSAITSTDWRSLQSCHRHPSSPPTDVSCRHGSVSLPHPSLDWVLAQISSACNHEAARTLNREVLKLVVFLKLRCGLRGGGGWLPVRCIVYNGFCSGSSSLCGARHLDSVCEVRYMVQWWLA